MHACIPAWGSLGRGILFPSLLKELPPSRTSKLQPACIEDRSFVAVMVVAIVDIPTQRCFAAPLLEGPFMHCIGPHLYCPCIILYSFVLSCILVLSCTCRCMCVVCCLFPCLLFSSCLLSVPVFVCLLSVSVYVCLLLMFSCFRVCCFIFYLLCQIVPD